MSSFKKFYWYNFDLSKDNIMKNIIVPVDFSKFSELALKAAANLASKHNATIITVHMLGFGSNHYNNRYTKSEEIFFIKQTQECFNAFLDKSYLRDINVIQEVRNETVFSELNEVVEKYDADLIVMGSHGADGFKEVFVGSNTEKVVRTSKVPVLVIKSEDEFNLNKIVFACDFKQESIGVFEKALHLFNTLEVEPHLVYINTPSNFKNQSEIDNQIVNYLIRLNTKIKILPQDICVYNDYSVEEGIFNYAKKIKANSIAIPTHGRKGLAHLLSGSIGEAIANHSTLPVITYKIEE